MNFIAKAVLVGSITGALAITACSDPGKKVVVEDELPTETSGGAGGTSGEGGQAEMCPHVGDPLVDPTIFPPCPMCTAGGAGCVPKSLLPPENLASFAECDADSVCVPHIIVETRGNFIPATCESVFGAEGRCLSKCLPSVAPQVDSLPQSTCSDADACVPCFDPFTQQPTGACALSCDPGPTSPPIELQSCCSGDGVCLPIDAVGDKADDLDQDNCAQNEGEKVCVPSAFLDSSYSPPTCVDGSIIGDAPGVCLPACLPAVQGLLQDLTLDQEGCPANTLCAPCDNPITGNPTGACDL